VQLHILPVRPRISFGAGVTVKKQRKLRCRGFGMAVAVFVTAHDDALFPGKVLQPVSIGEQAIGGSDPGGTIGVEDVLADSGARVRFDAVPDRRVHHGDRARLYFDDQFSGNRLVRVILIDILVPVAAWQDDQIAHVCRRQIRDPVADFDLQGKAW